MPPGGSVSLIRAGEDFLSISIYDTRYRHTLFQIDEYRRCRRYYAGENTYMIFSLLAPRYLMTH